MNNQTEETASWKPLTKSKKERLKLLKKLNDMSESFLGYCAFGFILLAVAAVTRLAGAAGVRPLIAVLFAGFSLSAAVWVLRKKSGKAKAILALDDQLMVFYLTKGPNKDNSLPRLKLRSCGPVPSSELRTTNIQPDDVIAVVLPLGNDRECEIYIPDDFGRSRVQTSLLRLETIEAHWGVNDLCTVVRLADKNESSRVEMTIGVALRRIYENRFRINSMDIDSMWGASEGLISGAEQAIASFQASIAQCEADRSTLVSAIVDAATALSNYERLFRSWTPVCEIGGSLVRTLNACPSRKLAEKERAAAALAEFQKKRKNAG